MNLDAKNLTNIKISGGVMLLIGCLAMKKYESAMYLMTPGCGLMIFAHAKLGFITFRGFKFTRSKNPLEFCIVNGILAFIGTLPILALILDRKK